MNLKTVAEVIKELKGSIPDSFRTLLAHRMLNGLLKSIPQDKRNHAGEQQLAEIFHAKCDLKGDLPFVNHDLQLTDSDLATFCNRWMALEKYKDEEGEWQPFSPAMNSVRYTMVKELQAMQNISNKFPPETD